MEPSPLYARLLDLSSMHAKPTNLEELFVIRSPDAIHSWGHNYLVRRNPKLGERMDNEAFRAHLHSTGPYLQSGDVKVHDITIDEFRRTSVIHMSYFLRPAQSNETVEQELIWTLKFTDDKALDNIFIKESVEFIDAAASSRVGEIIRTIHGYIRDDVRGGITLEGY